MADAINKEILKERFQRKYRSAPCSEMNQDVLKVWEEKLKTNPIVCSAESQPNTTPGSTEALEYRFFFLLTGFCMFLFLCLGLGFFLFTETVGKKDVVIGKHHENFENYCESTYTDIQKKTEVMSTDLEDCMQELTTAHASGVERLQELGVEKMKQMTQHKLDLRSYNMRLVCWLYMFLILTLLLAIECHNGLKNLKLKKK